MSAARDSQRSAVYAWERQVARKYPALKRELTLEQCREMVHRVWEDYFGSASKPPEILDGRGRRRACGGRWSISLPRWSRSPYVVLHETAHAFGAHHQHGPNFARLYLELMNRYEGIPLGETRTLGVHQKPRRVRFAQAAACPKPRSAAWRRWRREVTDLEARLKALRGEEPK